MLALKIKRREAVGIVGCLSSWTIQYRPGGQIETRLVSVAVEWDGLNTDLVAALVEVGWLDRIDDKWVRIHDWKDITSGYRKAKKDAKRKAAQRAKEEAERDQKGSNLSADSPRTQARPGADIQRSPPRADRNELIGSDLNGTELNGTGGVLRARVADEVETPPSIKSGTVEHQLAAEWNRGRGWPITAEKGARLVRCALDAGADAQSIQTDFWNEKKTKGRRSGRSLSPTSRASPSPSSESCRTGP